MQRGDTFLIIEPGKNLDTHLQIVISELDEEGRFLCVNLTTFTQEQESACILEPSDHSWIKHQSCIYYGNPNLVGNQKLDMLLQARLIKSIEPCSVEMLDKIYRGAENSRRLELGYADLLHRQGFIDL